MSPYPLSLLRWAITAAAGAMLLAGCPEGSTDPPFNTPSPPPSTMTGPLDPSPTEAPGGPTDSPTDGPTATPTQTPTALPTPTATPTDPPTPTPTAIPPDRDRDGYPAGVDCDDNNPRINPGALELCDDTDQDCDGIADEGLPTFTTYLDGDDDLFGDPDQTSVDCRRPQGYVANPLDCDDQDPDIHPGAPERCGGVDDDCDEETDEGLEGERFPDADHDGFGDAESGISACDAPQGYIEQGGDCDDGDPGVFPGATETCNGADDDCDQATDEGVSATYYLDEDGDGFGDPLSPAAACQIPPDHVVDASDCDDLDPAAHPGAVETCNETDDDCDTATDEGVATLYYLDGDHDGHGDAASAAYACQQPADHVLEAGDCDDGDPTAHPGATEMCDDADDDCDGSVDEGLRSTWYRDADGDGHGDDGQSITACADPGGYTSLGGDCDDGDPAAHPGATETCNESDDDCDGGVDEGVAATWHPDLDQDGYGDPAASSHSCQAPPNHVADGEDCDDGDPAAHPGATETCNESDDDCDGGVDEGVSAVYFEDADDDGYGDPDSELRACGPGDGYVDDQRDCDDTRSSVHPGAAESCNQRDDDCDTRTDEGVGTLYYPDDDGDGFGDESGAERLCSKPSGWLTTGGDCDDTRGAVNPDAIENCSSSRDDDCSGQTGGVDPSCQVTGYAFAGAPDCGSYCYYDEAHNVARNGAGQESNNNGYNSYALGQLTDGARGVDTISANLGHGAAYEWVAWSGEDAQIYVRFGNERTLSKVILGLSNAGSGGIGMPTEIQVFLSHGYNQAPYDVKVFRADLGTLPAIPSGKRGDITLNLGSVTASQLRIYCFRGNSWTFVDEMSFQ